FARGRRGGVSGGAGRASQVHRARLGPAGRIDGAAGSGSGSPHVGHRARDAVEGHEWQSPRSPRPVERMTVLEGVTRETKDSCVKQKIIINADSYETRIAIVEDGELAELLVERAEQRR